MEDPKRGKDSTRGDSSSVSEPEKEVGINVAISKDYKKVSIDMSPPSMRVFDISTEAAHLSSYNDKLQQMGSHETTTYSLEGGSGIDIGDHNRPGLFVNQSVGSLLPKAATIDLNNQHEEALNTFEQQDIEAADKNEWDTFVNNHSHAHGFGVVDENNMEDSGMADAKVHQDQSNKNGVSDSHKTSSDGGVKATKRVDFRALVNMKSVENVDTNYVKNTWAQFGLQNLMKNDDGVFLFKFKSKDGLEKVLERVVAYSADSLSLISTQVGKPIMLDAFTSSMCEDAWGRISYARALVEINVDSDLKHEVSMAIPLKDGSGHTRELIKVEYEWKPPHCADFKIFGHTTDKCPKRVINLDTPSEMVVSIIPSAISTNSDGFTEVRRKKKKGADMDNSSNVNKVNNPSTSNSFDALNNMEEGVSSSMNIQEDDHETRPNTSQCNEDHESDNEVDKFIFPKGDKFEDKFDIRLKSRVRK
uniref:Zinc knuckle CX2CX4HX4C n=1 Tax=Tanacetum cinerariifolium TaxID=118510 RepID=A0A6L2MFC8_TANCI|nr:hypothetical protein [Tanacetum cinerariifolium]